MPRLRFVPKPSREARGGRPDLRLEENRSRASKPRRIPETESTGQATPPPPEQELEGHQVPREQRAPLLLEGRAHASPRRGWKSPRPAPPRVVVPAGPRPSFSQAPRFPREIKIFQPGRPRSGTGFVALFLENNIYF